MKNNTVVIALVALLVGGGAGFFGGVQYQKNQRQQTDQGGGNHQAMRGASGQPGQNGGRFGGRGGSGAAGDILSVDSNSITVKLSDGSSKIVVLTGSTAINKAASASASDLTVGERVAAFGTTNSDGSITATNVQINPAARGQN